MSTDTVSDFFDAMTGPDTTAPAEPTNETETPETPETPEDPSKVYPNVLKTYRSDEVPAGENPTFNGKTTMTVSEFAGHLTLSNIRSNPNAGLESIVKDPTIYNGVKAKRSPLPVVLVFPVADDGTVDEDHRNARVYLPVEEAAKAYLEKPERGSGTSSSKRNDEDLIADASGKRAEVKAMEKRLESLKSRLEKAQKQLAKYETWLKDRKITWEQVDEYDARKEEEAANAEETLPDAS